MEFQVLKAHHKGSRDGLIGTKDGITFEILDRGNECNKLDKWYVICTYEETGKVYHSLWDKLDFNTIEDAKEWCENTIVKI